MMRAMAKVEMYVDEDLVIDFYETYNKWVITFNPTVPDSEKRELLEWQSAIDFLTLHYGLGETRINKAIQDYK